MKISQSTLSALEQHIDIEDVVSDFVSLKKRGQNLLARCPFHDEKTPSFTVSPAKGIYKCFGCGKGGDAINFIMEIEGISYVEALKYLAQKYGVEIEEEKQTPDEIQKQNERESLFIALNFANEYFIKNLWDKEEGLNVGLSYFNERGYDHQTIKKFELGYAMNQWDSLLKEALNLGHSEEILEQSGLIIRKDENRIYDRFRGRVIFPIHNLVGKVIAFGARTLKKDEQPKYINSPETEIYHKSKVLYGMHLAKNVIRNKDNCFLVEGYTDVISMHLSGIENVVASSGTSLTSEQIKLINRYTENVTVLFDGDPAGIKASLRGIDMILEGGLNVRVAVFPDGEDPDSYSRKVGSTAFQKYLDESSQDFITFKVNLFKDEAARDPIRKSETIKDVVSSIAKIPDPVKRTVYVKQCSKILEMDESVLVAELNKIHLKNNRKKRQQKEEELPDTTMLESPEQEFQLDEESIITLQEKESIRLLINYGFNQIEEEYHLYDYLLEELEGIEFYSPVYKEILEIFKQKLNEGKVIDANYLIKNGNESIKNEVINLVSDKYEISPFWEEKYHIYVPRESEILKNVIYTNILRLKLRVIRKLIKENLKSLQEAIDVESQNETMKIHTELKKSEMEIAEILGNVIIR